MTPEKAISTSVTCIIRTSADMSQPLATKQPPTPAAAIALSEAVDGSDLLDFSRSSADVVRTPGGDARAPTSRESWVAEMNAELAEFDALTTSATPDGPGSAGAGAGPNDGRRWKQALEQELAQHLTR
mmetsp:Transcript_33996/g.99941  ORF Transcript_33996/g.99941 Transcript_33996/m.99941 type:complete len:128 (+) Transcript_33996:952-1335(+)